MKSINAIQLEHAIWARKNFPNTVWQDSLMGVVEEVGELHHYLLKQKQHIRGSYQEHEAGAKDSVGDIFVYLMHLCTLRGWDMQQIIEETHEHVMGRDWNQDKLQGVSATKAVQGSLRTHMFQMSNLVGVCGKCNLPESDRIHNVNEQGIPL